MKYTNLALALSIAAGCNFALMNPAHALGEDIVASSSTTIEDPYADDQASSPWTMTMENVTTYGGKVVSGAGALIENSEVSRFNSYTPYFPDRTSALSGYGSSQVGIGCDGINLGGIIDGQLAQYQQMVEGFIQNAPTLAIMYLAYSQPTVKAVIDELNNVGQFGLDLTNMSCSGVRAIADKAAEEKAQAMAEARCTAEAGYKDPECMSDDGLLSNVGQVMKDTKQTVSERSSQYLGKVSSATGGLVQINSGIKSPGDANPGAGGSTGSSGPLGVRTTACSNIESEGLRTMILAASGMPCDDIENYSPLLPDYKISDNGESGVIPRTLTLRKYAADLVVSYEGWINEVMSAKENEFINTNGFKAIYNRTGVAISRMQHRKLAQLMTSDRQDHAQGLSMIRNLAQLIALKDLNNVVNNLEIAVLTGIQNQPDDQVLSDLRKRQYVHSVETLKSELDNLTQEVNWDLKRNELIKSS